jgi:hypothetical protein
MQCYAYDTDGTGAFMPEQMIPAPHMVGLGGSARRIGVELEFSNIGCRQAAELVQTVFGGDLVEDDPHRFHVVGSELGTFVIELDTQYAHPPKNGGGEKWTLLEFLQSEFHAAVGEVASLWLPVEIVSPPVALTLLPKLDKITDALRRAGAHGTDDGLMYAFATQLNPEVPSCDADVILAHLKAFLLLSDRLRAVSALDVKRRLLPFADPMPRPYVLKVVDPAYRPALGEMIDDYIAANPTRNRELDMLPLFTALDPDRVHRQFQSPLLKARPTFHYRLPDTRLSDPDWGLITEWNRWVQVEWLAADPERLEAACSHYCACAKARHLSEWSDIVRQWLR